MKNEINAWIDAKYLQQLMCANYVQIILLSLLYNRFHAFSFDKYCFSVNRYRRKALNRRRAGIQTDLCNNDWNAKGWFCRIPLIQYYKYNYITSRISIILDAKMCIHLHKALIFNKHLFMHISYISCAQHTSLNSNFTGDVKYL